MFERAVCCSMRLSDAPVVNCNALRELQLLLMQFGSRCRKKDDSIVDSSVVSGADEKILCSPSSTPNGSVCRPSGNTPMAMSTLGSKKQSDRLGGKDGLRTSRPSSSRTERKGGSK